MDLSFNEKAFDYMVERYQRMVKWQKTYTAPSDLCSYNGIWCARIESFVRNNEPVMEFEVCEFTNLDAGRVHSWWKRYPAKILPYRYPDQLSKDCGWTGEFWFFKELAAAGIRSEDIRRYPSGVIKQMMGGRCLGYGDSAIESGIRYAEEAYPLFSDMRIGPISYRDVDPEYGKKKKTSTSKATPYSKAKSYYVYEYYIGDRLLYIGQSIEPYKRFCQHCSDDPEYKAVTTIRLYKLNSRNEMNLLEEYLISKNQGAAGLLNRKITNGRGPMISIDITGVPVKEYSQAAFAKAFGPPEKTAPSCSFFTEEEWTEMKEALQKEAAWEKREPL